MSDTPRTDAAWSSGFDPVILSAAELARRLREQCADLERENAALREKAERYRLVTLKQDAELAALRSFLREAITDHVSPYDLPESEDYIARVRAALGQDKP